MNRTATRLFIGSILLNLGLLACIFLRREPLPSKAEPTPQAPRAALSWSQLESDDYATYLANLRAAGCPEATIRNILTAELAAVYVEERKQVQQKEETFVGTDFQKLERARETSQKLAALEREQRLHFASLFPRPAAPAASTTARPSLTPTDKPSSSTTLTAPQEPLIASPFEHPVYQQAVRGSSSPLVLTQGAIAANNPGATNRTSTSSPAPLTNQGTQTPAASPIRTITEPTPAAAPQTSHAVTLDQTATTPTNPPPPVRSRKMLFTPEQQLERAKYGWQNFYYEPDLPR